MKILILGGNRFFGKKLTALLLKQGHKVTLLNRGNIDDGFGSWIKRIYCDRTKPDALKDAVANLEFDIVFDQVCYESVQAKSACEIFQGKTGHYIFTSSQSVYNPGENIKESVFNPKTHSFSTNADSKAEYAEAKRQCEAVFFTDAKFPMTAVRFPMVVGPDDYTERFKFHIQRLKNSEPIYFPNLAAKLSFIHSDDAAQALAFLATLPASGPINVSSCTAISLQDFISTLEKTLEKKFVLADTADEKNHSPYGVSADWYMNTEKINSMGFAAAEIKDWLPELSKKVLSSL